MRHVFEAQGLSPEVAVGQELVAVTLRHAVTHLEREISVPSDACIRDVKKILVRPLGMETRVGTRIYRI